MMKQSKSCFEGLKTGPQISALIPTLKTEYSVLRVAFKGYIFEGVHGYFSPECGSISYHLQFFDRPFMAPPF
jgi:hypothetical protein